MSCRNLRVVSRSKYTLASMDGMFHLLRAMLNEGLYSWRNWEIYTWHEEYRSQAWLIVYTGLRESETSGNSWSGLAHLSLFTIVHYSLYFAHGFLPGDHDGMCDFPQILPQPNVFMWKLQEHQCCLICGPCTTGITNRLHRFLDYHTHSRPYSALTFEQRQPSAAAARRFDRSTATVQDVNSRLVRCVITAFLLTY